MESLTDKNNVETEEIFRPNISKQDVVNKGFSEEQALRQQETYELFSNHVGYERAARQDRVVLFSLFYLFVCGTVPLSPFCLKNPIYDMFTVQSFHSLFLKVYSIHITWYRNLQVFKMKFIQSPAILLQTEFSLDICVMFISVSGCQQISSFLNIL